MSKQLGSHKYRPMHYLLYIKSTKQVGALSLHFYSSLTMIIDIQPLNEFYRTPAFLRKRMEVSK